MRKTLWRSRALRLSLGGPFKLRGRSSCIRFDRSAAVPCSRPALLPSPPSVPVRCGRNPHPKVIRIAEHRFNTLNILTGTDQREKALAPAGVISTEFCEPRREKGTTHCRCACLHSA
jgi:hypothetical protein